MITDKQKRVVELLASGKNHKEIVCEMGTTYPALQERLQRIKRAMNAKTPAEVVYIAMKEGIIK